MRAQIEADSARLVINDSSLIYCLEPDPKGRNSNDHYLRELHAVTLSIIVSLF